MYSLIFGEAIEIESDMSGNVRLYHVDDRTFLGTETFDIVHACSRACANQAVGEEFTQSDDPFAYVNLSSVTPLQRKFATVDIVSFDPGDDPYVLCTTCEDEMLRDDEKFFEQYG